MLTAFYNECRPLVHRREGILASAVGAQLTLPTLWSIFWFIVGAGERYFALEYCTSATCRWIRRDGSHMPRWRDSVRR